LNKNKKKVPAKRDFLVIWKKLILINIRLSLMAVHKRNKKSKKKNKTDIG